MEALRKGMILHFSFDKINDRTVINSVNPRMPGTIEGQIRTIDGMMGNRLGLEGDTSVTVPEFQLPGGDGGKLGSMTIAFWAKFSGRENIIDQLTEGEQSSGWLVNSNGLQVKQPDGKTSEAKGFHINWRDPWQHFVVIIDQDAGEVTLYTDGGMIQKDGRPAIETTKIGGQVLRAAKVPLVIGRGRGRHMVDEVTIWNRALCHDEVKALVSGGKGLPLE